VIQWVQLTPSSLSTPSGAKHPVLCVKLLDLLQEAEAAKARGDQSVGLTYYRAAIEAAVEELGHW
jgi:hypothetical protein